MTSSTFVACRLQDRTHGIPVVMPCPAVVLAMRALRASRLAVVHPPWFPPEIDQLAAQYFEKQRLEVVYASAAGIPGGQASIEPMQVFEWVRTHVPDAAEAVFVGGGGLRAIAVIDALEQTMGRPVLTANQVLFWQALRCAGLEKPSGNYGRIFAHALPDGS